MIQWANADGSGSPATLYDAAAGVVGPRQIVYDPSTDRLYWTQHSGAGSGEIMGANADGSATPDLLYSYSGGASAYPYGIDVDPATGLLYWTEADNTGDDMIMVAPADGSGTPIVLFSGPFQRLRGIAAGVNILPVELASFSVE